MKKFVIDQLLLLFIGIVIMISLPFICGPIFTFLFEIVVLLCWGYLCRRILVLPIDLILGNVSQIVYFASQYGVEELHFIKGINYHVWKFYLGNNQTIRLFIPIAIAKGDAYKITLPPKDAKLKITYFRLSRILIEWEKDRLTIKSQDPN